MTATEPIWMNRRQYAGLRNVLAEMRSRIMVEVPDDVMDYDAKRIAVQRRIRTIEDMLAHAVVCENPPDGPVAGPGMVLTIRYDATGETETFLLGRRAGEGAEGADLTVYSLASPLGRAIAGARRGEQRIYAIPHESGQPVTLLEAVPLAKYLGKPAALTRPA